MLRRGMGPQRVSSHDLSVEKSTSQLLLESQGLRDNPTDTIIQYVSCIQRIVLNIWPFIVQITYGEQIWDAHGPELVALNIEAMHILFTTFGKSGWWIYFNCVCLHHYCPE
jgi:hypothetical protein